MIKNKIFKFVFCQMVVIGVSMPNYLADANNEDHDNGNYGFDFSQITEGAAASNGGNYMIEDGIAMIGSTAVITQSISKYTILNPLDNDESLPTPTASPTVTPAPTSVPTPGNGASSAGCWISY